MDLSHELVPSHEAEICHGKWPVLAEIFVEVYTLVLEANALGFDIRRPLQRGSHHRLGNVT